MSCQICNATEKERKIHMVTIIRLPYQPKIPICASCLYDIAWQPLLEQRLEQHPQCYKIMRKVLSDIVHEKTVMLTARA